MKPIHLLYHLHIPTNLYKQDYQKFTPYGLDFRLYSKDIIKILDFKDFPFRTLSSTIG